MILLVYFFLIFSAFLFVLILFLNNLATKGFHLNKKAWALIDLSCMRVYAIKCLIMGVAGESICAHMGYLELDLYGKTDMVRPNQPAVEEFTVEHLLELGIFY